MNVGQLQVILNYLLTQIETLNENLVEYLITRDELAIEQDSLLTGHLKWDRHIILSFKPKNWQLIVIIDLSILYSKL